MAIIDDFDLKNIRELHNITADKNQTRFAFNRFKVRYPDDVIEEMFGYVFFTRPQLHLFQQYSDGKKINSDLESVFEYADLLYTHLDLFRLLQDDQGKGNFIYPLCNMVRNFPVNDTIIKTRSSAETANDWKIEYGHRKNESLSANTVDLSFCDNRNLDVYNLIKIWVTYIDGVSVGRISPYRTNIVNRILDYAGSIYFFLTSEDAATIKYYCKLIGVFPINIPNSVFTWELGNLKPLDFYNITFHYSSKDESPAVIKDFNRICGHGSSSTYIPNITNYGIAPNTWCNGAFIQTIDHKHKLRFTN